MTHRKPLSLTGLADPVLHLFHLTINIFWQNSFRKDINIFWQRGHSLHIVICKVEALPNPGKHRHQKMKAKQEYIPTSSLVILWRWLEEYNGYGYSLREEHFYAIFAFCGPSVSQNINLDKSLVKPGKSGYSIVTEYYQSDFSEWCDKWPVCRGVHVKIIKVR